LASGANQPSGGTIGVASEWMFDASPETQSLRLER